MPNREGRPNKFKSPEDLMIKGLAYIKKCRDNKEPILITGLALALDTTRRTLIDTEGRNDEFSHAIKELKTYCENYAESKLFGNNAAGPIFALKNYQWSDKQEIEHSGEIKQPLSTEDVNLDKLTEEVAKKLKATKT